jgi:hypothetical protein
VLIHCSIASCKSKVDILKRTMCCQVSAWIHSNYDTCAIALGGRFFHESHLKLINVCTWITWPLGMRWFFIVMKQERYAERYAQSVHIDVVLILEVLLISSEKNEDTLPY